MENISIAKKLFESHHKTIKEQIEQLSADELKNIGTEVLISILAKHHALCSLDTIRDFVKEHGVEKLDKLKLELEMI